MLPLWGARGIRESGNGNCSNGTDLSTGRAHAPRCFLLLGIRCGGPSQLEALIYYRWGVGMTVPIIPSWTLSANFDSFFKRLNPSPTFEGVASSQYNSIKSLIENPDGNARELSPICFLQGSYRQHTAIYTINDVDIITLCRLWYPGTGSGHSWSRNEIFDKIAAPLLNDGRYRDKVRYNQQSMCIKLDLGIKVEILPVVYKAGNNDPEWEPFCLYRPESAQWVDGFARYHQALLTEKNKANRTNGNFIRAIKVLKHLRSRIGLDAVSFHMECLLFSLDDNLFQGGPADYIASILVCIASTAAPDWYSRRIMTPCGDRDIFVESEWRRQGWETFHNFLSIWAGLSRRANQANDKDEAIRLWQTLLGEDLFPTQVSI